MTHRIPSYRFTECVHINGSGACCSQLLHTDGSVLPMDCLGSSDAEADQAATQQLTAEPPPNYVPTITLRKSETLSEVCLQAVIA